MDSGADLNNVGSNGQGFVNRPKRVVAGFQYKPALVLLLLGLFLSPFRFFRTPGPWPLAWTDLFVFLAGVITIYGAVLGKAQLRLPRFYTFACVILTIGVINTWVNDPQIENIYTGSKFLTSVVLVALICAWVSEGKAKYISYMFLALGTGNLLIAVIAIANKNNIFFLEFLGDSTVRAGRYAGPTHHPVWLANTTLIALPLIVYFVLYKGRLLTRLCAVLAAGIIVMSILNTGSRSALVAIAVVAIPFFVLSNSRIRSPSGRILVWITLSILSGYIVLVLLSLSGAGANIDSAFNRLLFSAGSAGTSDQLRLTYMEYAWTEFLDNPFTGTGFQNIWLAHSGILSVFHSSGLITGVGYLVWVLACVLAFLKLFSYRLRMHYSWNQQLMLTAIFASFIGWQFNLLVQSFIAERSGYFVVGLLLSLFLYPAWQRPEGDGDTRPISDT